LSTIVDKQEEISSKAEENICLPQTII